MRRNARVRSVVDFGLFVDVAPGMSGLVHRNALGIGGAPPQEHFAKGDEIQVKIMAMEGDQHKLRLSRAAALEEVESGATAGRYIAWGA